MADGWIGVDFDGTLAYYDEWRGPDHVGVPLVTMCDRVRRWLAEGRDVRIFTARVSHDGTPARRLDADKARLAIGEFCRREFGRVLPVTCSKDYGCVEIWDDRAIQVVTNTGERVDGCGHGPWQRGW